MYIRTIYTNVFEILSELAGCDAGFTPACPADASLKASWLEVVRSLQSMLIPSFTLSAKGLNCCLRSLKVACNAYDIDIDGMGGDSF